MSEVAPARRPAGLGWSSRVLDQVRTRIPPGAVAYSVPPLVAAVAVQMWFRRGGVLAGGDLTPPVVPGTDYRAHWNQFDTGAGAPSFQIVSFPYFEGLRLFAKLGLDERAFQRVWLTLLAAGVAAAVMFLARSVVESALAAAVAAFLATFNAYRLTETFDSLPLMAMLAAATLGGLVIRAGGERSPRPLVFGLASTTCAFVFLNPPHLALVGAWLVASIALAVAVHGRAAVLRLGRFLLAAGPLALLFNLWWIVPAALSLTNPLFHARFAAAGVEEWAWTQVRASVPNVLALTSSWAWGRREYFPFSAGLERFPYNVLQYVPFAAALLGLVLARAGRLAVALVLAVTGLVTVLVMKGLHPPLSGANKWLYDQVPGLWLLREPTKAGFILVLVYALLAALAIAVVLPASRSLGWVLAVVMVVGAAFYAHPLLSGGVVPTKRPLLPPARVEIPDGWRSVSEYMASDAAPGKVAVLPRLDYYQAPTTWGYYGATFLHQLISRPVVDAPLPGGYYRDPVVPDLLTLLEVRILERSGGLGTLLQELGARYILLRRDLVTDFPGRSFVSPHRLDELLRQRRDVRLVRSFGIADLFEARTVRRPEVYAATPLFDYAGDHAPEVQRVVDVGPDSAVARPDARRLLAGVPAGEIRLVPTVASNRLRLTADLGRKRVRLRVAAPAARRGAAVSALAAPARRYRLRLGVKPFVLDGPERRSRAVAARARDLSPRRAFAAPSPVAVAPGLVRSVGDCYKIDRRTLRQVGIAAGVVGTGPRASLWLTARDHSGCVSTVVAGPHPPSALRLRLLYRTVLGNPARVCVWMVGPNRCAPQQALDASPGWHRLDAVVPIAPATSSVWLFLYADGGGRRTISEYRRITIAKSVPRIAVAVAPVVRLPEVTYQRVSPSEFHVRVRGARAPFLLVATETYAPGWRLQRPRGRHRGATHLRVNGYANGWRLPWSGSYELTIDYAPERLAELARRLDLVAIPLGLLALLLPPGRLRRSLRPRAR